MLDTVYKKTKPNSNVLFAHWATLVAPPTTRNIEFCSVSYNEDLGTNPVTLGYSKQSTSTAV